MHSSIITLFALHNVKFSLCIIGTNMCEKSEFLPLSSCIFANPSLGSSAMFVSFNRTDSISDWVHQSGLLLNTSKTQLLIISRLRHCPTIYLTAGCVIIPESSSVKYLGITPVTGLQGGLRGHRPILLLYLGQLHANFTCIFALMQEFLYQFCIAYFY